MILKGRLKTDFLFQTTFFMDISNQRRRGRGNTLCGHDFRFGRGGKRWVFVDFLSVITPFLKMNFYMRENGGGGGISCFI